MQNSNETQQEIELDDELLNESDGEQYFFFVSGGDIYAVNSNDVAEMIEYQKFTKVPLMTNYVKGVANIRGSIVAVVDLQERFGFGATEITDKTSLVIVKKKLSRSTTDEREDIALIINEVYEVGYIKEGEMLDTPSFGTKIPSHFIKSMTRRENKYIAILNIEAVLEHDVISKLGV